jgi:hypothetical protein
MAIEEEIKEVPMDQQVESERFIPCSDCIVLECRCGEKLFLLGYEADWYREERTVFECGCGEFLSLANRHVDKEEAVFDYSSVDEQAYDVKELLRQIRARGS